MSFRYRLLSLDSESFENPEELFLKIVGAPPEDARRYSLTQWKAVMEHLRSIGASSMLVQSEVRDPDFLAEYDAFYARQHRPVDRHCHRLHAFTAPVLPQSTDVEDARREVLAFVDSVAKEAYLGFVTLRPLRHAPIGPTILSDSPFAPGLAKDKFPVHIAGVSFTVHGAPFMQQDNAVGACAQASIWMALRTLRRRTGNSAYSPAELTLAGTQLDRISPGRHALSVKQMLDAIQASGHDPLIASVQGGNAAGSKFTTESSPSNPATVLAAVRPYIYSGLPVILVLRHPSLEDGHAVVAIGESPESPGVQRSGLIIHNDNAGPYQVLPHHISDDPTEYALDQVTSLIVPLPHGIVMTATEAESQAKTSLEFWMAAFQAEGSEAEIEIDLLTFRSYLCSRHAFRRWAVNCVGLDDSIRDAYRTRELPQYVWVIEIHNSKTFTNECKGNSRLGEVVLDAGADVRHGEGVLYVRLTHHMFLNSSIAGSLLVQDIDFVFYENSEGCKGLHQPWAEDVEIA